MLMNAGFSQKKHRCLLKIALNKGFSNQMCYGTGGSEALMPKKVWDSADSFEFLHCLGDALFDGCL